MLILSTYTNLYAMLYVMLILHTSFITYELNSYVIYWI